MRTKRRKVLDLTLHLLFPKKCIVCRDIIRHDAVFCDVCASKVALIKDRYCNRCARHRNRCVCKGESLYFDGVISTAYYQKPLSNVLVQLKLREDRYTLSTLARMICDDIAHKWEGIAFDLVVAVPTFRSVKNDRGTVDRITHLSKYVAKRLRIPFVPSALQKNRKTTKQHTLKGHARRVNVWGSFSAKEEIVRGKTILLIDDTLTTGSTLQACAHAMKEKHAKAVYCATIAATILYDDVLN